MKWNIRETNRVPSLLTQAALFAVQNDVALIECFSDTSAGGGGGNRWSETSFEGEGTASSCEIRDSYLQVS